MNDKSIDILLVEDNPDDATLTIRSLEKHNLANSVVLAKDGQEALDFIFGTGAYDGRDIGQCPTVVLLDLKLPKVDGLDVLKCIKADLRTRSIPVVVLTSSAQERDIVECYRLGVNSYIVKPVAFRKFMDTVRQLGKLATSPVTGP